MAKLAFPDDLTAETFLAQYWQRNPLLLRGAVDTSRFELSPDELAGLALEPDVEARLVRRDPDNKPEVLESPYEEHDLTSLPDANWTLLVQDVDKHLPELAGFLDAFDFIPSWRLDDLMISVAAPGGGVGPHVDQYDVFLCQMHGHRRWTIGEVGNHAELQGTPLRQIAPFATTHSWVLAPGDVLYLPPGIPHDGVAEDLCCTWSVGFRAPTAAELLAELTDKQSTPDDEHRRYSDPDLSLSEAHQGLIGQRAIRRFRELLGSAVKVEEQTFVVRLGEFLTRPKAWLASVPNDEQVASTSLLARLRAGEPLDRHGMALFARAEVTGEHWLFVSGKSRRVAGSEIALAKALCSQRAFKSPELVALLVDDPAIALINELYNDGQLLLENDWETRGDELPG